MRPAQHDPDSRQKLARLEGFRNVVLRAHLQANHAVHRIAARGQHDHRDRRRRGQGPDLAEEIQAVRVGKHQVEDDEVRVAAPERRQSRRAVRRMLNLELVLPEIVRDHPRQADIVLNQQN